MRDWLRKHSSIYAARHRDDQPVEPSVAVGGPFRVAAPDHPAHAIGAELHQIGSVNVNGKLHALFCDGSEKLQ